MDQWLEADESGTLYITEPGALALFAQAMGLQPDGARDYLRLSSGLASALARPRNAARYEEADLALQAAYLAHGIAESQSFIDGNKRLALVCLFSFLQINGHRLVIDEDTAAEWIFELAGAATPHALAERLRASLGEE